MQSILTYLLAVTLEAKKESFSMVIDNLSQKIIHTHKSHHSFIKSKINKLIVSLKKASQEESRNNKSQKTSFAFFFALYCDPLPFFEFKNFTIAGKQKFVLTNEHLCSDLWVTNQPHPPQA